MDVDLLRPGTIPISPETTLWFEFLLDRNLLLAHLQKDNSDPSPTDLIIKFATAVVDSVKNDSRREMDVSDGVVEVDVQPKYSLKNIALKIMSVKVAAYIKWNLGTLRTLPFKIQVSLLQDLLYFTNNETWLEIPDLVTVNEADTSDVHMFALTIYYRWLLGTCMHRILTTQPLRTNGDITQRDENLFCTQTNIDDSIAFLKNALNSKIPPPMVTFDCFEMLSEDSHCTEVHWDKVVPISVDEHRAEIHYTLGIFYFFQEHYALASSHFDSCMQFFQRIVNPVGFCTIDRDTLENYIIACTGQTNSLLQQLSTSICNQFTDIINILIQDNQFREIPIVHRLNLELDIHGAMSSGTFTVARDLLPKIKSLNAVRCLLEKYSYHQYSFHSVKCQDLLLWATSSVWKVANNSDKAIITDGYLQIIFEIKGTDLIRKILEHNILHDMLDDIDTDHLIMQLEDELEIPSLLTCSSWDMPSESEIRLTPSSDIKRIEQNIIACYDQKLLRTLLCEFTAKNFSKKVWKINPKWEISIPLQSVVSSMQRGFLQDFSFVLLAKSQELLNAKNWAAALGLLRDLQTEIAGNISGSIPKMARMITWEILLVQISQFLDEWPVNDIESTTALAAACESCLEIFESPLPRTEVLEHSVICLLNLRHWDFLERLDRRMLFFEIASAITMARQDIVKYKADKCINTDLWDIVLPVFHATPSQTKRSSSGTATAVNRDSPTNAAKTTMMSFVPKIRDSMAFSIVISMLAKLYNILRDEPSMELKVDYIYLWPSVISNVNSYSSAAVVETLLSVLQQALTYYPANSSWLRLCGDIHYVDGNYESCLKYYLLGLANGNEYFHLPVRPDNHVFRRMISALAFLSMYTQAAVLCQFLDEPDYQTAFRYLQEPKASEDAQDAHYHCIWDVNILEFLVHHHTRKNEPQRRKRAIHTLGLLELNANNNEEIQREARNLRKGIYLRALAKQYVL